MKDTGSSDKAEIARLGYGVLDLSVGQWALSDDVAGHTNVRHPENDEKYYARELLRVLGKRFSNQEACAMWLQIEKYRESLVTLYGPPGTAVGRPAFEQTVREWYASYGNQFEKAWYLQIPLDIHYAQTGRERVWGRWLRIIHPELRYYIEAGFSSWEVLVALGNRQWGGWYKVARRLWGHDRMELTKFWIQLGAYLMNFPLDELQFKAVQTEIIEHANRLNRMMGYPVEGAAVVLDYYRRLQLAGLGPEVVSIKIQTV